MHILLTGANGYIGSRLLPALAEEGHQVTALVRSANRLIIPPHLKDRVKVITGDLLNQDSLRVIPEEVNAAYYLVHSMGQEVIGFSDDEACCAENFIHALKQTHCKQIIYLSGLASDAQLSEHMTSRRHVETILNKSKIPVTSLRASIIIGSGSASFEIIRDLVEKLPMMVAPRWVRNRCQPIAIRDIIFYLKEVLGNTRCYDKVFEIGGPEALTYHQMLMQFAEVRGLSRLILPVPLLTPRLSSYWLFFVTSTNFPLAQSLVDSLKTDSVCQDRSIQTIIKHNCLSYKEALRYAFAKIEQNIMVSSWKDALVQSELNPNLNEYIEIPVHGCLKEQIICSYNSREEAIERLWAIGGKQGWYYMNWAWRLRGWMDRMLGGIGLRRGRTHPTRLRNGDALDFWRVLLADKESGRLLLYTEMRLPGEAWLEYQIHGSETEGTVTQTATFRPRGIFGRLYWYALVPIHYFMFRGLCSAIAHGNSQEKKARCNA